MNAPQVPVFELEVSAMDVTFEARVNDLPVLRMPAGSMHTIFDVNPYVQEGENALSLIVRPRAPGRDFSEHAACSLTVRRRPSPGAEEAQPLGTLAFTGFGAQPVTGFEESAPAAGDPPVEVERFGTKGTLSFLTDAPFGPWAWSSADKLAPSEQLRSEVLAQVRKVHALLAGRDGPKLAAWCALQAEDFQKAYGLSSLDHAHRLLGIAQLVADLSISVEPFPESILTLEILGGGRLVHLVDDEGKSPLTLRSKAVPKMLGRFNCVFCKTAAGWQIAR